MTNPTYGNLPVDIDPTAWYGRTYTPPIGLDIATIQSSIAAQLASSLPAGIASYIFPDYDLDTWWKSNSIAFTLLAYRGTSYSKPLDTSAMVQERTLDFSLFVAGRTTAWALAGTNSIYGLIDAVEAGLTGFRPLGCRNGYFTDERFKEQDPQGRVWLYEMKYRIVTVRPKLLTEYTLANLQQITNLIYDGLNGTASQVEISGAGTLQLPANTVVLSVTNSTGVTANQGQDYTYSVVTGALTTTNSGVLTNGSTVTVVTSPVTEPQNIS